MQSRNEKISDSLKKHYRDNPRRIYKKLSPKTNEEKANLSKKITESWNLRGRLTDKQKRAKNVANVVAYRARLKNAIASDSDLSLIRKIYENCPERYHVDHILSLAKSGLHHQDNLQYLPISENCRKGKDRSYDKSLAIDWRTILQF
jgi:hypothetical protein